MGAFARLDRKQFNKIKEYYGEGIMLHIFTKDSKGNYIRYIEVKQNNGRINGVYIGYGYLLNDMR